MSKPIKERITAVKSYLSGSESLRRKAKELGIHHNTLLRWVKWYRESGEPGLDRARDYSRPWNRFSQDREREIIFLREKNPNLSLSDTKELLEKKKIRVSLKGIWNIWKRYGYAGFEKSKLSNNLEDFLPQTRETEEGIAKARTYLKQGKVKKAAKLLNELPFCPDGKIMETIPDGLLASQRKLEKLSFLFGKIPYARYRKKIRELKEELLKQHYYYSSIRAGIKEVLVLEWLGKPREQLDLIKSLKGMLGDKKKGLNAPLWFTLCASEFIANIRLMETEEAIHSLKQCKRLSRTFSSPSFLGDMATLYSYVGYHREMALLLERVLEMVDKDRKESLLITFAYAKCNEADYRTSLRILRGIKEKDDPIALFVKAFCFLALGRIEGAKEMAQNGLLKAQERGILGYVSTGSLLLAEANAALREKRKSRLLLLRYIELLRKLGMNGAVMSREIILGKVDVPEGAEKIRTIKLALLLKKAGNSCRISDYRKAYRFAARYKMLGILHRLVLLIPEPVHALLAKGKETGLPRTLLHLPVFRKEIPVYFIKFLGNLVVYKNQKYLRVRLSPKDISFLIYIAFSSDKRIPLEKIYTNFWPKSKNPSRNCAHLLVRIRKVLRLPSHYLYVKGNSLCFDCYFTTDYAEYEEHIAQAKILQKGGKWGLAKRGYLQAFLLFRGEPFKKMYDDWSDDKRLAILFNLEKEASTFIEELFRRNNKKEAKNLMKRLAKIVPL